MSQFDPTVVRTSGGNNAQPNVQANVNGTITTKNDSALQTRRQTAVFDQEMGIASKRDSINHSAEMAEPPDDSNQPFNVVNFVP